MDYYDKIIILQKYFGKYIDERKFEDMRNTLNSMKSMHGQIINIMAEVQQSNEINKLEVLSDLQITNNKMAKIITQTSKSYDKMMEIEKREKEPVINVPKSIVAKLNKDIASLILFYADWCGPCKNFIPIWDQMKSDVNSNLANMVKFSCVEHKEKCDKLSFITSFPTVVLYNPITNSISKFTGDRTIPNIIKFVNMELNTNISQ